jgi:hypothetical protein
MKRRSFCHIGVEKSSKKYFSVFLLQFMQLAAPQDKNHRPHEQHEQGGVSPTFALIAVTHCK